MSSRRSFWPTVLAGVAGSGLAAIAGSKAWVSSSGDLSLARPGGATPGEHPEVTAIALVVLALWGVVLVTRGRVRRALIVAGVLVSAGLVALAIHGLVTATEADLAVEAIGPGGSGLAVTGRSAWAWVAPVVSVLALLAAVVGVLRAPAWPEMGQKYDAPGSAPEPTPQTPLEWWKAMDEGRDPTDTPAREAPPEESH